jgi:hypothetical protein
MQVQIRRFLIEYHIYARGLIILDEVAARVGGVSDKCAFVALATRSFVVPLCKVFCCAFAKVFCCGTSSMLWC